MASCLQQPLECSSLLREKLRVEGIEESALLHRWRRKQHVRLRRGNARAGGFSFNFLHVWQLRPRPVGGSDHCRQFRICFAGRELARCQSDRSFRHWSQPTGIQGLRQADWNNRQLRPSDDFEHQHTLHSNGHIAGFLRGCHTRLGRLLVCHDQDVDRRRRRRSHGYDHQHQQSRLHRVTTVGESREIHSDWLDPTRVNQHSVRRSASNCPFDGWHGTDQLALRRESRCGYCN